MIEVQDTTDRKNSVGCPPCTRQTGLSGRRTRNQGALDPHVPLMLQRSNGLDRLPFPCLPRRHIPDFDLEEGRSGVGFGAKPTSLILFNFLHNTEGGLSDQTRKILTNHINADSKPLIYIVIWIFIRSHIKAMYPMIFSQRLFFFLYIYLFFFYTRYTVRCSIYLTVRLNI